MNSRLIKILFSGAVGLYISLVCFNNIFDSESNFPFIKMVASMEDTFSKERDEWRSINNEILQEAFFALIVIWELFIAVLLWAGFFKMIKRFRATALEFKTAKKYTSFGLSLGVLLWVTVFIAVGGEWFLMWQSKTWNAQGTAFSLTSCFLLFLIHHNQEDA
jgi:predicted small integral membrane protein